jgi:endonuclease G
VARSRRRRNPLLVIAIALIALFAIATRRTRFLRSAPSVAENSVHLELGTPRDSDPSDDLLLRRAQYVLSYNPKRNVANWASYRLLASDFGAVKRHQGKFLEDPELPAGILRVSHDDYSHSGFDRGHLVRSAERTSSRTDNDATFFMTNVVPQKHELNEGPWLRLEEHCEKLARVEHKQLFIVSGPIFTGPPTTIGGAVRVPDEVFKIVVVLEPGEGRSDVRPTTSVIAVSMPNAKETAHHDWDEYKTTIDAIEARTGYDFLDCVDVAVQAVIEAR